MTDNKTYIDNNKRGKLLSLAVIIAVGLFWVRGWSIVDLNSNQDLIFTSMVFFLFTYISLLVIFRFRVTWRTLLVSLPQSSLFVAGQVLFVMMFFFRDFLRVSDFVVLLGLLILIVITSYATFLTTNVFNVASFKPIPLLQVASTASYISTVFMIYFFSFAVINLSIPIVYMILMLFVAYILILLNHFTQISIRLKDSLLLVVTTALIGVGGYSTVLIGGTRHELSAIVPATIVFGIIGIEMSSDKAQSKRTLILQYVSVVAIAFIVNITLNK